MIDLILFHWATHLYLFWFLVIVIGNLWPRTKTDIPNLAESSTPSRPVADRDQKSRSYKENQDPAEIRILHEDQHAANPV